MKAFQSIGFILLLNIVSCGNQDHKQEQENETRPEAKSEGKVDPPKPSPSPTSSPPAPLNPTRPVPPPQAEPNEDLSRFSSVPKISATLVVSDAPNGYRTKLKWDPDLRPGMYMIHRRKSGHADWQQIASLATNIGEYIDTPTEHDFFYDYKFSALDSKQNLLETELQRFYIPIDFEVVGKLPFASSENRFRRMFLYDSHIPSYGSDDVRIVVDEIVAKNAVIQSYNANTSPSNNQDGRHGGNLTLQARRITGSLTIYARGTPGGKGPSGARGVQGSKGTKGADSRVSRYNRESKCVEEARNGSPGNDGQRGAQGGGGRRGGDSGRVHIIVGDSTVNPDIKILLQPGEGGPGGDGGPGGFGGEGGDPGTTIFPCMQTAARGPRGQGGPNGPQGPAGPNGTAVPFCKQIGAIKSDGC